MSRNLLRKPWHGATWCFSEAHKHFSSNEQKVKAEVMDKAGEVAKGNHCALGQPCG